MKKILLLLVTFFYTLIASPLQDAIDNAKEGSILRLNDGIYRGKIVINKPLTLLGVGKSVIIDGEGEGTVIAIKSSFVTIKNITIQNSGDRHDKLDSAITIADAKQCEVSNCKIRDCLFGIDMQMVNNSIISNNTITSKDFDLGLRGDGLRLWYSNDNIVRKNITSKLKSNVF